MKNIYKKNKIGNNNYSIILNFIVRENVMNEFEKIKKMYDEGYRCIMYDDSKDGDMSIYFKNFESEASEAMRVSGFEEKMKIKNFVNNNSMK